MNFTTVIFFFIFFPLALLAYYAFKKLNQRLADIILVGASLIFYSWTLFDDVFKLILYILILYLMGLVVHCISHTDSNIAGIKKEKRKIIAAFIVFLLGLLFYFKYWDFFLDIINSILGNRLTLPKSPLAPLGISYIIFSSISYLIDIKRGQETPRSFLDTALYISFFPKVASGPIVRYKDFFQNHSRAGFNLELFHNGLNRIIIGMTKKLLFADYFGQVLLAMSPQGMDPITAVFSIILYSLQLYFDFSGYSDIAIGLGMTFGYRFPENFEYPYIASSITEFWRRWHITLGAFFREYLYIPLGGNRKGKARTLINLAVVFLATGIWHGAGLGYLIWGGMHGLCVIGERLVREKKFYKKTPVFLKWLFTTFVVFLGWQFFRFQSLSQAAALLGCILGASNGSITFTWQYYFTFKCILFTVLGWLWASVPALAPLEKKRVKLASNLIWQYARQIILLLLFVISVITMVSSSYSPFIYFRY